MVWSKTSRRALAMTALIGCTSLTTPALARGPAAAIAGVALPTGGRVTAGAATISTAGNTLTIGQTTSKAIIDWGGFSIGQGGTVDIHNGSGATLNRVTGTSVSSIDGLLTGTGSVYLINPNGVVIGRSGIVKTGGTFVASTLDLPDASFLGTGPYTFTGPSKASVVNLGKVGALGGDVALIATTVANTGSISAPGGAAGLISGGQVVMTDTSLDGGRFAVALPAAGGSVTNSGLIEAATAELRANGGDIYALAGDTSGVIRATGVAAGGGHVWLVADGGATQVAGTIEAQGAGGTAGTIETSGETVDVGAAKIDAHGGSWTLDPTNLEITAAAASTISNALATTDVTETTTATGASGTGTQTDGAGDITLDVGAAISWDSTHALTLSAYHDVNLLGTITLTGAGGLTLRADNAATGSGTVKVTGTSSQVTLASGATANVYYNPTSYTDTATQSTQTGVAIPQVEIYTNPYTNPYAGSNSGQQQAATAPVMGGTVRAYMLVNSLAQLGGGLTGVGSQLNGLYALNVDIDATSTATANPVPGMSGTYFGFIPIGYTGASNTTNSFTGVFDGQNHTISNLYVNHFTLDSNGNKQGLDNAGLFGVITGNDAGAPMLNNLNVLNATVLATSGSNGVVVGTFQGNAFATNLTASGTISGGYFTGGLFGSFLGATLTASHASTTVNGGEYIGGLFGQEGGGRAQNVYATGSVTGTDSYVGGLVGSSSGTLTDVYATGAVTAAGSHVGGLAGSLFGTATNAYATGSVTATGTGVERIGGLAGDASGVWTDVYATGSVTLTGAGGNQVGGLVGRFGGNGTLTTAYATGAVTIGANPNNNVGSFGGLIGYSLANTISNTFATGAVNSNGGANVGGLIGTILAGSVSTSYASGAVNGVSGVGGLIGGGTDYGSNAAGLTVTDSYATGSVTGTGTAANAATSYIGGLVGYINHDEPTAGATSTLTRTYATGLVSGSAVKGGLIGGNTGVISNSIWDRTSTGQADGVGATITTSSTSNPPITSVTNLTSVQDTDAGAADYAFSATPYTNAGFLFGVTPGQQLDVGGTLVTANWVQIDSNGTLNGQAGSPIGTRPLLLTEYSTTVTNAHQLQLMQLSTGASYTLANDIDARATAGTADVWGPDGFVAVAQNGYAPSPFTGTFEGAGHSIIGLTERDPAGSRTVGLFGRIDPSGVVRNVALVGGSFTSTYGASSLASDNAGTISNVSSSATVNSPAAGGLVLDNEAGGIITGSSASGAVSGEDPSDLSLGGLVAVNAGTITNSSASGTVSSTGASSGETQIGGLVGINEGGTIANSSATGTVSAPLAANVGGLVGLMYDFSGSSESLITNSFATGAVSGGNNTGGLVGAVDFAPSPFDANPVTHVDIINSYASGVVTGASNVGGLVGVTDGGITSSYATGNVTGSADTVGGLIGAFGLPPFFLLGSVPAPVLTGSRASGNVIGTSSVGGLVGASIGAISDSFASGAVSASDGTAGGLVGLLGQIGSTFAAATIDDSHATGAVTGDGNLGGLVGYATGGTQITSTGGATYASGAVSGTSGGDGGLVGVLQGGSITGATASGPVSGAGDVGGLVGIAFTGRTPGTTDDVFPTITNSSASGAVTATAANAGGLLGTNTGGTITDSYATGAVSGVDAVGGLVGLNGGEVVNASSGTSTIVGTGTGTTFASGQVIGTGRFTGGVVGINQGVVSNVDYRPTGGGVFGTFGTGGLVGLNDTDATLTGGDASGATIVVSSGQNTGGAVGYNYGAITAVFSAATVSGAGLVGGLVGANDVGGTITDGGVGGFVTSSADYAGGVVGWNAGTVTSLVGDAPRVTGTNMVGGFAGFNSGTLTNVVASGPSAVNGNRFVGGVVGYNYGTVTDAVGGASVTGGDLVGGVAGVNDGSGTISGSQAGVTVASASGSYYTGGLVGWNSASISGSSSSAAVTGGNFAGGLVGWSSGTIADSFATGAVTAANEYAGGLVAYNGGTISNVYATGAVTATRLAGGLLAINDAAGTVQQGYATGLTVATAAEPDGTHLAGGIAAYDLGTLTDLYWDTARTGLVTGVAIEAGTPTQVVGIGGTTGFDPNAQETYVGFDFTDHWQANDGTPPTLIEAPDTN